MSNFDAGTVLFIMLLWFTMLFVIGSIFFILDVIFNRDRRKVYKRWRKKHPLEDKYEFWYEFESLAQYSDTYDDDRDDKWGI